MNNEQHQSDFLPGRTPSEERGRTRVYDVSADELRDAAFALGRTRHLPLLAMFAKEGKSGTFVIQYIFGVPTEHRFLVIRLSLPNGATTFPSLATTLYTASIYERRIKELFGLEPEGYPGELSSMILHDNMPKDVHPMRHNFKAADAAKAEGAEGHEHRFMEVEGEGIWEVPVGPVHAGIIEPGHFRFSMLGEEILNLEPKLGWMHKGSEKLFEKLSLLEAVRLSERIAGDTSFMHAVAFLCAVEELAGVAPSPRGDMLRVVYGELERLASHFNDIGFILSDTGFNFGGAHGTRLRERVMRLNERLTGSRFLRGVAAFGGAAKDIDAKTAQDIAQEMNALRVDLTEVTEIAKTSSILDNRLRGTGRLAHDVARDIGAAGYAARASGVHRDARTDYPSNAESALGYAPVVEESGDVYARYMVRVREIFASIDLILAALLKLPKGEIKHAAPPALAKNALAVGIAEGWRGDIVYAVSTGAEGVIDRVAVRDPSFTNWHAIPHAAPGNVILDFPLINKSFNLSYTGYDI